MDKDCLNNRHDWTTTINDDYRMCRKKQCKLIERKNAEGTWIAVGRNNMKFTVTKKETNTPNLLL